MQTFRHYLTTRFNAGLYRPDAKRRVPAETWMEHRWKLFTTLTLPSIIEQRCQDFTWLVLMDRQTPECYLREMESFRYANLKMIFPTATKPVWQQGFELGQYDLLTTRLDNDDALHHSTIETIQQTYLSERTHRAKPWVIVFPFGLILELKQRQMWILEYWFNNCPTLVEPSEQPKTAWHWDHSNIPADIGRSFVKDKPYWLQVVHSQNVLNEIPVNHRTKILHKKMRVTPASLRPFGVSLENLPTE